MKGRYVIFRRWRLGVPATQSAHFRSCRVGRALFDSGGQTPTKGPHDYIAAILLA